MGGSQVSRRKMVFFVPKEYNFMKENCNAIQNQKDEGREIQGDEPSRNEGEGDEREECCCTGKTA